MSEPSCTYFLLDSGIENVFCKYGNGVIKKFVETTSTTATTILTTTSTTATTILTATSTTATMSHQNISFIDLLFRMLLGAIAFVLNVTTLFFVVKFIKKY
jgi:hypothetical protein